MELRILHVTKYGHFSEIGRNVIVKQQHQQQLKIPSKI